MMKEILRTEAMPFTITQISCYISAGAEVKRRTGLPDGAKRNRKQLVSPSLHKRRKLWSAVGLHQPEPGS